MSDYVRLEQAARMLREALVKLPALRKALQYATHTPKEGK